MKRFAWIFLLFSLLSVASIISVSYYIVFYFTGKRTYSNEWYKKNQSYKNKLIEEHKAQSISLKTKDGLALSALLFEREEAKRNLLFCHGWWMNKEKMRRFVTMFPDDNLLFFDFRAHGQSEGDFSSMGYLEQNDVMAAYHYLIEHSKLQHLPIYGLGISMGAATLLGVARQGIRFKGLVIDSVFESLESVIYGAFHARTGLPTFPFWQCCQSIYSYRSGCLMSDINPVKWAKSIELPICLIHSEDDKLAHYSTAHKIYQNLKSKIKRIWMVKGSPHAVIFKRYSDEYIIQVQSFFCEVEELYRTVS